MQGLSLVPWEESLAPVETSVFRKPIQLLHDRRSSPYDLDTTSMHRGRVSREIHVSYAQQALIIARSPRMRLQMAAHRRL